MESVDNLATDTPNMENLKQNHQQMTKRGRGRPRKNQVMVDIDKNKKNKIVQITKPTQKNIINKEPDEEIILHLPISLKDLNTLKQTNGTATANATSTSVFEHKTTTSSNNNNLNPNIFTINDINSDSDTDNSNYENNNIIISDLKQKIKNQEKLISGLQKEVSEYKSLFSENITNGINSRKVSKMNLNLIETNTGKSLVAEQTNIACWWCTHNFDTMPCFIPEKIINETYYVFGCFCSYNCAASYNLKMEDSYVWNRYSLLKKLYSLIYKTDNDISLAPPREVFSKFGGLLSYEEYKKNNKKCMKEYRFIMPPMTSIVPLIEEGCVDSTKVNVSLADLNKKNILRRNKPLPGVKNTLFETLGIKENK